jgi:ribosomal protein S18 acetylase RimI-like enzyme
VCSSDLAINKYGAIDLEVKKDNKIAINLYKKHGFKIISDGRNNKYYYMKLIN